MKIFFYGEHPKYATGMGNVGDALAQYLAEDHDVTYYGKSTSAGIEEEYHGYTLVGNPTSDPVGQKMFGYHFKKEDYDAVVTNLNWRSIQWLAEPLNSAYMNEGKEVDVVLYTPVETETKPPFFEKKLLEDHLNPIHLIPFNKPTYERMRDEWGLSDYLMDSDELNGWVPHGVDRRIFKPVDDEPKLDELEQDLGFEDDFIVMFCGENWRRKNIDVLAKAFRQFAEGKENVKLLLHTAPIPSRSSNKFFSGWDMRELLVKYDIADKARVMKAHPSQNISVAQLALEYNLADVYINASGGEGFSMTSLEAMSTGTPCIHSDLDNIRWLCGDASRYVEDTHETCMRAGEELQVPNADALADKIEELYQNPDLREEMGDLGIERAKDLTWERAGTDFVEHVNKLDVSEELPEINV